MAASLETAARLLDRLHEEDRDSVLAATLATDLEAQCRGFGLGALAPRPQELEHLSAALGERSTGSPVQAFHPFQGIESWSGEDLAAVLRCLTLFSLTTARQLVPHLLAEILVHAGRSAIPVMLLVDEMDSVRDPRSLATRAADEVGRSAPGSRVRVVCLGGERFEGPSLDAAISGEIARLRDEWGNLVQERGRSLARLRAGQVRSLLEERRAALSARRAAVDEAGTLVNRGRLAAEVIARSEATLWSDRLAAAAREIQEIRADALAPRVLEKGRPSGTLLTGRMENAVRDELRARLGPLRPSAALLVRADSQDLLARLIRDRDRYATEITNLLGDLEIGPAATAEIGRRLESALDRAMEELDRRCIDEVQAPSKLVDVLASYDLLSDHVSGYAGQDEPSGRGQSSPSPVDGPPPVPMDGSSQLSKPEPYQPFKEQRPREDESMPSELLAGVRQMVNYQVIRRNIVAGIAQMLEGAWHRAEEEKDRARHEWGALLDEWVRAAFSDLEHKVQREHGRLAERTSAVEQGLDELRT